MGNIKWHPEHPYYKRVAGAIDKNQKYMEDDCSSRKKLIVDILESLFLQPPLYSAVQPRDIKKEEYK